MAATLAHRGPDAEGTHTAAGIQLGFRRLAIMDLDGGDQPILSEDGQTVLICNGEIYNASELRRPLEANGHRFRTRSDAEVILHLYEERGPELVHALRGMFAFALWDRRQRRLLLARDRLGIKPLYWTRTGEGLVFGSEIKAILASGLVQVEADPTALATVFTQGLMPAPLTLFRGIHSLPPGHILEYQDGTTTVQRYWRVEFPHPASQPRRPARQWVEGFRHHLEDAVRTHLRSDVPLGLWLSPGIDSSTVAALAHRMLGTRLPAFTLAFEDPTVDERAHLTTLADFPDAGIDGGDTLCTNADIGVLPWALWHGEAPSTGGIEVPRMLVSRAAAQSVKVVLAGEGADELLGGYAWYPGERRLRHLSRIPSPLRHWIATRPVVQTKWPGGSRVLAGPVELELDRYLRLINAPASKSEIASLLAPEHRSGVDTAASLQDRYPLPDEAADWHWLQRLQAFDLGIRLQTILHTVDRASMAHSLEVRVPYLDHRLIEFCATIPPLLKLGWRREKEILRQAVADLLPAEIVRRRKRGMQAPIAAWFRPPLPEFARELLSPASIRDKGYFDADAVEALAEPTRPDGGRNTRLRLGILTVQLWDEIFCRGWRPPARVA